MATDSTSTSTPSRRNLMSDGARIWNGKCFVGMVLFKIYETEIKITSNNLKQSNMLDTIQ
ncbi:hypothetical protein DFA_07030 [Cavenderia fasciculata]|uniref:Uncharacterized protein n=1 Tax=Cavenderia fasciculata TaxID=261658 RepID=F4PVA9_CACFS|nr:uncharacterized protein DFA_07030 [Cavenderia fasciculata]EGG19923.1 hypothetical protein DFA_07030 [Cavenderia fasciculata]|eukprot:XP_004366906.1 hypothetical protein DFA_07030 [Cavenderia fasciculata]